MSETCWGRRRNEKDEKSKLDHLRKPSLTKKEFFLFLEHLMWVKMCKYFKSIIDRSQEVPKWTEICKHETIQKTFSF